jgi:hypothetical protein
VLQRSKRGRMNAVLHERVPYKTVANAENIPEWTLKFINVRAPCRYAATARTQRAVRSKMKKTQACKESRADVATGGNAHRDTISLHRTRHC